MNTSVPAVAIPNIARIRAADLDRVIDDAIGDGHIVGTAVIAARNGEGIDLLKQAIVKHLPEGPAIFPNDYLTDQPARFMAGEIVRERVLLETEEELPYATTVIVENFEEGARLTRISATIYCEREGQKGILIGKKGEMLKRIGTSARLQIERMLGTKVFLELYVKVQPNWRESRGFVEELDWRRQLQHLTDGHVELPDKVSIAGRHK